MNKSVLSFWVSRLALINLMILAFLGIILRYKIAFSLPFIQQKFLLHSHSHFAFSGWVSQMIMTCIVLSFQANFSEKQNRIFKRILIYNSVFSYAQLFAFLFQGYGLYSIIFSSTTTLISFYFGILFWRICNQSIQQPGIQFFKSALVFNVVSSIGTGSLVYLMVNQITHQEWYLASVYFFLHFQYNGFFIFSLLGLFFHLMNHWNVQMKHLDSIFWMFTISLPFAYLLSIIWANLPWYIYLLAVSAAFMQFFGWISILFLFVKNKVVQAFLKQPTRLLFWLAFLSGTLKFFLQLVSVIPSVSQYAFGFRPIVIAYLHLVLLGFVTLFLIGYFIQQVGIKISKITWFGLILFLLGILGNELVLMFQGLSFFGFWSPAHSNELLLGMAGMMFLGLVGVNLGMRDEG